MLFVIFLGLICLALSAFFFGETVTLPARERKTSVRRAAHYGAVRAPLGAIQQPFRDRALAPLGDRLASGASAPACWPQAWAGRSRRPRSSPSSPAWHSEESSSARSSEPPRSARGA